MALDTLANLKLAITERLDIGSAMSNTQLDDVIRFAENKVVKKLRVRDMESALASTIAADGTSAVPTGYLDLKYAYVNTSPIRKLERKAPEWIYEKYPARALGQESFIAREGSNFIFGDAGTPGRIVKGIYYASPTAMTATINSLFTAYPEVYFFAALSECESFIGRDDRINLWESKYQQVLTFANQQDKDEGFGGGPISATTS